MKTIILIALLGVLAALASAGFFMLRKSKHGDGRDNKMARALTVRIALSVALFVFILVSWKLGWIVPSGLPIGR